jgi:acyl carrier protein
MGVDIKKDRDFICRNLLEYIRKLLNLEDLEIQFTEPLISISGWDSLNALNLLLEVEKTYQFQLDPGQMDKYETISHLADLIIEKTQPL